MSTTRIDELRAKFDENPRRYFAPLANELRKIGDHTAAIALCREYLPKQPGHMSGHIVYGQALFEFGAFDESRDVFEAALSLDPENVIALKHLGEIARARGDNATARRWYERWLDADPRNDEIAQQLAQLFTPQSSPATPTPAPAPPVEQAYASEPQAAQETTQEAVQEEEAHAAPTAEPLPWDGIELPQHADWASADARSEAHETAPAESANDEAHAIDEAFASSASEAELLHFEPEAFVTSHDSEPEAEQETDVGDVLEAFASHDPGEALDPHFGGSPTAEADIEEPVKLSELEFAAEFEEGLLAPEWPDTSLLEERSEQDVHRTPALPAYSEEAVAAFGREVTDPDSAPVTDETDAVEYGEREQAVEAGQDVVEQGEPERVVAARPDLDTADYAVVTGDYDAVDEGVHRDTPVAELSWIAPEQETESTEPEAIEPGAAQETEHVQGDRTEPVSAGEDEHADSEGTEFISASIPESEPELREVAEAIARDARNSGETEAIRVEVHEAGSAMHETVSHDDADHESLADTAEYPAITSEVDSEEQPAFVTETMAELLVSQGFLDRAISVYDELVRRRPFDVALARKLEALRARQEGRTETPAFGMLSVTPQEHDAWQPDIQIAGEELRPRVPTPLVAPRIVEEQSETARPTARIRFAQLASRRVPRRTPPRAAVAVEPPSEGLAGLFGAVSLEATEDYAARAFADAFAPMEEPPDGAGLTASAFGSRKTSGAHEAVSGVQTPPRAEANVATPKPGTGFSFDRFFPDPATVPGTPPGAPADASRTPQTPPAAPVSDDLAEFAAWLKGLDKP